LEEYKKENFKEIDGKEINKEKENHVGRVEIADKNIDVIMHIQEI